MEYNDDIPILCNEINLYKEYWNKHCNDSSQSPLYHSVPKSYDRHTINLPTKEVISISWDIEKIYNLAYSQIKPQFITIEQFDEATNLDRLNSFDELSFIKGKVNSIHSHNHIPILLIDFKPIDTILILDGRHRYIEHKKFKNSQLIPVYLINDESCIESIILTKELLSYCILHNIFVINNYLCVKGTLERMLNIKNIIH